MNTYYLGDNILVGNLLVFFFFCCGAAVGVAVDVGEGGKQVSLMRVEAGRGYGAGGACERETVRV